MIVYIYIFALAGVGLIYWGLFGSKYIFVNRPRLPQQEPVDRKVRIQAFLTKILPTRKLLERLKLYERIKNKLEAAHMKLSAPAFFNTKIILMVFLTLILLAFLGKAEPWAILVSLGLGYLIPEIYVGRMIARRKYAIARLLPETVDLLGLCVEAGLDFATALKWIIEKTPMNPMLEELVFVLEEIKWGKSRTQALKDMAKRLNITEVSSFVQSLVLAERMGTPVAEAFTALSEDTRLMRFHRGERIALKAPIKILVPLIFCILPVILIIVGGPILLQFMGSGGGSGTMNFLGGGK